MPLTKLEHYLVLTDDIDRTRDFYMNALGLVVGARPPIDFPGYWLYLGDTPCIHIGERESYARYSRKTGIPVSAPAAGTGPVDHIAFTGTDYEDIAARLERHGVRAYLNVVPGIGLRQLFIDDPNGVKIEINVPPSK